MTQMIRRAWRGKNVFVVLSKICQARSVAPIPKKTIKYALYDTKWLFTYYAMRAFNDKAQYCLLFFTRYFWLQYHNHKGD